MVIPCLKNQAREHSTILGSWWAEYLGIQQSLKDGMVLKCQHVQDQGHDFRRGRLQTAQVGVSENRVPHCTQWFCWSLSLLNGYFIGGIPHFQTYPSVN